ncbi:hypothetical protein GH714_027633 [Hevea brasiliensis]|uniref:Retrotransposon gag domain-containing protein n=1 Tax=Hevea brasiliensis TaxID=3981 RepID=A0A6A6LUF0_HEVBR|nr:hypothetical protein GH714_027633 [Hevea brasiliensis]
METTPEKRVKVVAFQLKGGVSAWWERLHSRGSKKAEIMQKRSFDSYKTISPGAKVKANNYGGSYEKYGSNCTSKELVQEEKAARKHPMNERKDKETPKATNPYARLI